MSNTLFKTGILLLLALGSVRLASADEIVWATVSTEIQCGIPKQSKSSLIYPTGLKIISRSGKTFATDGRNLHLDQDTLDLSVYTYDSDGPVLIGHLNRVIFKTLVDYQSGCARNSQDPEHVSGGARTFELELGSFTMALSQVRDDGCTSGQMPYVTYITGSRSTIESDYLVKPNGERVSVQEKTTVSHCATFSATGSNLGLIMDDVLASLGSSTSAAQFARIKIK